MDDVAAMPKHLGIDDLLLLGSLQTSVGRPGEAGMANQKVPPVVTTEVLEVDIAR
jgi:hypothetical protein